MAHYAYISNEEFTITERARLREVENEINVIRQDNIESEGYQLLYSTLYPTVTHEDIKNAFDNNFDEGHDLTSKEISDTINELYYPKSTSETLKTLEAELAAIQPIGSEEYIAKEEELNAEKEKLAQDVSEIEDQLHELEYNNTEDLIAEKNTLETTINNALCRVANVIVGRDEIYLTQGNTSDIDAEIKALSESKAGKSQEEIVKIDQQILAKQEEKNDIPKTENDNTVYWEGYYYETKRTSYNGNIRKNFAGKGMIYDPERDAFYAEQPYPSWTLDEETCTWQPPTLKPEGQYYWKEDTTEWVDYVYYNPDNNQPYPSWVWDTTTGVWNPPIDYPEDYDELYWSWNEEEQKWDSRTR